MNDNNQDPVKLIEDHAKEVLDEGDRPAPQPKASRRAPEYYAGETYRRRQIQYPDVERYPNGALPSKRNKHMRRLIRGALKAKFSSLTKSLKLARGLRAQAYEIARAEGKSGRWARRLLERELAIHRPAHVPETRAARRASRVVVGDAISQLVDRMSGEKP